MIYVLYAFLAGAASALAFEPVGWWPLLMVAFAALIAVTLWSFRSLPTGFLPTEDQGYVIAGIQLPDAASLARTTLATN